jgi:preprotein translocase YajC subunit
MQEIVILAVVMLLGMGAYWSMVVFPKQRDFQKRQRFVRDLAEGDEVITSGGLIGRIVGLDEGVALVEIADGLVVRMIAASLLTPFDPELLAENARKGQVSNDQPVNEAEGH